MRRLHLSSNEHIVATNDVLSVPKRFSDISTSVICLQPLERGYKQKIDFQWRVFSVFRTEAGNFMSVVKRSKQQQL